MTDPTMLRLLICKDCKTIEQIPDHDGNPEQDHTLEYLVRAHRFPDGTEHVGMLARVEQADWDNPRVQSGIIKQLTKETGETGLGSSFYNARDTFKDDAMACFKAHRRDPDCNDFHSEAKRLIPDTNAARKEMGLEPYRTSAYRYLCDFCPVKSVVEQKRFDDAMKRSN